MATEAATTADVVAWIRQNAVPAECLPGAEGTDDLVALTRALDGVRVVGMAEVTHGTKEFYRLKHRLLRHLVTELGFTVLAIEGSHSSAQVINDHLLNGTGERPAALAEFGHPMWDVEEFGEAIDWLRAHNRSVPDSERVRFHGLDVWNTRVGRGEVLAYLRRAAPETAPVVEGLFRALAAGERQGIVLAHRCFGADALDAVRDLMDFLSSHRERLVETTSAGEYEAVLRQVTVIRQWIACNTSDEVPGEHPSDLPLKKGLNNVARSIFMGKNLIDLLGRSGPDTKVVVWAHSLHLGVGFHDDMYGHTSNMGALLRSHLGDRYYAFALEFDHGAYLGRDLLPDRTLGDHRVGIVPRAPEGSLAWYLSMAGGERFLLDLRRSVCDQGVADWLTESRVMHCGGWAHCDPLPSTTVRLTEGYDGLIFVRETTPTTPTANALDAVARRAVH